MCPSAYPYHILPRHTHPLVAGDSLLQDNPELRGTEPLQALLKVCNSQVSLSLFLTALQHCHQQVESQNGRNLTCQIFQNPIACLWLCGEKLTRICRESHPVLWTQAITSQSQCFLSNVSTPEQKKIYLFNWLSARALWISQVDLCSPSRFPSPQMWRDFLNTTDTDPLPSTQTALRKSAVWDILGEGIINSAQGEYYICFGPVSLYLSIVQVKISSLSNPPLWFIWSLLWELYELNFCYELYMLDWALVPNLWTSSDKMRLTCQTHLYSIFPGESSLVMWSESLPQDLHKLGLCATDVPTALLYINKFCHLLSAWPGAPACLQYLVEMKDQDDKEVYAVFSLVCRFYVQTAFNFLRRQPSLPHMFQFI
ncbi:hypothetical protein BKA82DRAFT_145720 [Pisolithus tinctorius]|uniref:Uncharacterized protein n=1 Tax=Pisolithus tinctorius Marx 270 TaxID=870435 RepID=A0A0C3NRA7_PISTI|nr:hypothetical protein BKA82DRAFT_145720 [Pisolithus tinctorius]KIO03375.1 hypothetical protein M404DRAFT_145720 [Pisolithus tinctorius Marx 270]